jgi:hypothetical protein
LSSFSREYNVKLSTFIQLFHLFFIQICFQDIISQSRKVNIQLSFEIFVKQFSGIQIVGKSLVKTTVIFVFLSLKIKSEISSNILTVTVYSQSSLIFGLRV